MSNYILNGKIPQEERDLMVWGRWFQKSNRHVAKDEIGDSRVSTVFLGMDHRFLGEGKPILFETMVFGGNLDGEMDRYCTWEEAEEGHKNMVDRVKQALSKAQEAHET